ncbi:MAG TPA: signal peptidase I [Azospirillaceae bacterium]|nr:signal peptidase I [Azospirillaceae bacterium]
MRQLLREWGPTLALATVFVLGVRTFAYAGYHVPSESMLPTLRVGDQFYAAKFAYGYSRFSGPVVLPFAEGKRFPEALPDRGDVVVVRLQGREEDLVKRVIGLPGDRVQVIAGVVHVNGEPARRRELARFGYREQEGGVAFVTEYAETLPGGQAEHRILERTDRGPADDTPEYAVPEGHVFLMGDNRDNSLDSRFLEQIGYIPVERVLGRADLIGFAWTGCTATDGLECPAGGWADRLFARIR